MKLDPTYALEIALNPKSIAVVGASDNPNKIVGKISKAHGNGGAVLARFDKGLPGQAVGTEVDIS